MRAILLAAGRGSRLAPLTDDRPKCLVPLEGKPLLEHQLAALRTAGVTDITAIGGYRSDCLHLPGVSVRVNPRWQESNMVRSLLCARDILEAAPCIVAYTDIVYGPSVARRLMASTDSLAIAYDPDWEALWSRRFADPLADAETFSKSDDDWLLEIGKRPTHRTEVRGQYMGLLRFDPAGFAKLAEVVDAMTDEAVDRLDMTSLLARALSARTQIRVIANVGPWGEVDSPDDLALFERERLASNVR